METIFVRVERSVERNATFLRITEHYVGDMRQLKQQLARKSGFKVYELEGKIRICGITSDEVIQEALKDASLI